MSTGERTGMERLLPHWHFREVHSLAVPADQETVMSAVYEAVWSEAPLARVLMAVTGADVSAERRIVTDSLSAMGDVIPSGDDEFLFAGIQALDDIPRPTGTTAELVERCTDPGIVKVGMNVRFAGGVLSTETRVLATDERTRRRFRPYWLFIRFGSGLTRQSMLRAIRARALRQAAAAG
ncbi:MULTISPECIES: hypothetical protein [Streptomyces]|uniref:hypothetical protein n=1 Tax=Streptomyces TaxID=1883 RepID=UPI00211D9D8C|nr:MULTISPECIES: hypothetical protein [unclassified Streptomyces]